MTRIRVVHCLDTFETGGTELNAVRTAERLDRTAFDVRFLTLSDRGALADRVRAAQIPIQRFTVGSLARPQAIMTATRIARWLREEHIDVVHAHDVYSNIFVVPVARLAGVPVVLASRRWWATETARPVHATLNRWSYRLAHRVVANSTAVATLLEQEESVPASRIVVVPNFADEAAFDSPPTRWREERCAELGIQEGDRVIVIVANLTPVKDHATAIRAIAQLTERFPRLRLVLVGEGSERAPLTALADSLGVEKHVILAGRRPSLPSLHWIAEISSLSSRAEGFPNALVEAMAAQRPIVATAVGGVTDAVVHGETGLLVPPGDDAAMAAAFATLLADPDHAHAMGRAGLARARARHHEKQVLHYLQETYTSLVRAATA